MKSSDNEFCTMAEHNSKHTLLSVTKLQEKLADDDLELAALDKSEGPLTKQLDTSLKEMNVERQAYHGKSFIGNHVHTCCKVISVFPS